MDVTVLARPEFGTGAGTFVLALIAAVAAVLTLVAVVLRLRGRIASPESTATYRTLHAASTAALHLRNGLTPEAASRAARDLRPLLGVDAVAIGDAGGVLAWEGRSEHHRRDFAAQLGTVLTGGRTVRLDERVVACEDPDCLMRAAILAPVVSDNRVVAVLASYHQGSSSDLVRATEAVAVWIATQIDIAELGRERGRAVEAELRALRAQISPHFVYNSLAAIASFVRTDPARARELLLDFADFTRYTFRRTGPLTPLSDELVNIERYLVLEEARFGDRMQVTLRVAPEVLGVRVPSFAIQPLVENAVQHGIEAATGVGLIRIEAHDVGTEVEIVIEDDGAGADPERIRTVLAGDEAGDHVGMANVDARLRQTFGDEYGLTVETALGAGTRVSFRVPKFHPDPDH
ncbi:histidine kinase [Mobilicoccus sp.]|uniref:histidine kinase n=1 Tax=Mobilicoccus sp. TaxID=2034349 RepID=UPI00289E4310|nr:histidine kinase [Mobilicoccus sp.]